MRRRRSTYLSAGPAPVTTKTFRTSGCSFSISESVPLKFRSLTIPVALSLLTTGVLARKTIGVAENRSLR